MESKGRNGYYFSFNAVKAYYVGLQGQLSNSLSWKLRAAYSLHTNARYFGFPIRDYDGFFPQTSIALKVSKNTTKDLSLHAEIGYDQGERVTNTLGLTLGLKYSLN
jgi:hypothetical protein